MFTKQISVEIDIEQIINHCTPKERMKILNLLIDYLDNQQETGNMIILRELLVTHDPAQLWYVAFQDETVMQALFDGFLSSNITVGIDENQIQFIEKISTMKDPEVYHQMNKVYWDRRNKK